MIDRFFRRRVWEFQSIAPKVQFVALDYLLVDRISGRRKAESQTQKAEHEFGGNVRYEVELRVGLILL